MISCYLFIIKNIFEKYKLKKRFLTNNVEYFGCTTNFYREEVTVEVLKVSAKSNPNSVAGALAGVIREKGSAEMQTIGAGALNQAVKAIAIARGFVAPSGIDLICIPAFTDIQIQGEERTAIKLLVEKR